MKTNKTVVLLNSLTPLLKQKEGHPAHKNLCQSSPNVVFWGTWSARQQLNVTV